jgi:glycosyltransferase involved in cell wall biosynthesis
MISAVLTTRNRQHFLRMALRFYKDQTFSPTELIVVDDSDSPSLALCAGVPNVTYIYLRRVLPLGTKLNLGIERARGEFILKMDDDDYYAPWFMQEMFDAAKNLDPTTSISFVQPFLFLNLRDLRVLCADPDRCSGATLFFHRKFWEATPFRDLPHQVDAHFLLDHGVHETNFNSVNAIESFLQVRHTKHLWNFMPDGEPFDRYLARRQIYTKTLDEIVSGWAFSDYSELSRSQYSATRSGP